MESKNYEIVAKELNITVSQVETVLNYFKEGATVPFIARYRQSQTNNLNEEQIYAIQSLYLYASELSKRKEKIIEKLKELNLLNNDLEQKINSCTKKSELESIYEPYKSGKITKAKMAIELGLMPLALKIW
ncbi:RNA (S1 domain)-binding protein, partial [Mycoplasmopsis synoviae]